MDENFRRAHRMLRELRASAGPAVEAQRKSYIAWAEQFPLPPGTVVTPLDFAPGLWVSVPESEDDRVVLQFHGGAYRLGAAATHREYGARLAAAAKARVALLDYPLAPENSFPAATNAAFDAYVKLLATVPANRIALTGDSAGGGLVMATLLRLRDEGIDLPAAAAVNSPWVDLECTGTSMETRADRDPFISQQRLLGCAEEYLAGESTRNPYASPIHGDLTGLPPLLIQVGTEEVLYSDALELQRRAEAAGVHSELLIFKDAPHIWQHFSEFLPAARDSFRASGEHILGNM